jgi:GMP reductase
MRIENDSKLDYSNVLLRPNRSRLSSRKEVNLTRIFNFKNAQATWSGIPIMAANMDGVGTFEMAEALYKHQLFTCLVKSYSKYEWRDWITSIGHMINSCWAYSMGITNEDLSKFDAVYDGIDKGMIKFVCIDVANGYTESFVNFVNKFRNLYPEIIIIAGNVVTAEMTEELILNGADIVKVGVGPGSVCITRTQTGVGYPQLSATIECADAAHGLGGFIIADGGCVCPGDVAKAFGGGADFVMLGGMLAGHDEGGGDRIHRFKKTGYCDDSGKHIILTETFVQFYGMSSAAANDKHFGGLKEYRSSEGREVLTKYLGPVSTTVQNILGGLRSACTYIGASRLKDIPKCTTFVRCSDTHNRVFE